MAKRLGMRGTELFFQVFVPCKEQLVAVVEGICIRIPLLLLVNVVLFCDFWGWKGLALHWPEGPPGVSLRPPQFPLG